MSCYTLYCTTLVHVLLLPSPDLSNNTVCAHLVAGVGVALPLGNDHGLEVLALGQLGLDLLDVLSEVGCVLRIVSLAGSNCIHTFLNVHPRAWSTPPWARADGS